MTDPADSDALPRRSRLDPGALRGTVLLIGDSDTGKTTVARSLYRRACRAGVRAAYLDGDMGQSTLGLPTTMTVALGEPGDDTWPPRGPRRVYFVGSTTPRRLMLPTLVGVVRLRDAALALGAELAIVDTTGLVAAAEGGRALKQAKIELLAPDLVIALQRDRELEPLLWPLRRDPRVRLLEWAVSPRAVIRSREARVEHRRRRLAGYLEGARSVALPLRRLGVYELERLSAGALLALLDGDGWTLGLGVVEQADPRGPDAVVRTPLPGLEGVAAVRIGVAHWDFAAARER